MAVDNTLVLNFAGLVIELLVYGVYCIVFSGSVWVLQKRRRGAESQSQTISPVIEVCSWFIFLTLTIHCVTGIYFRYQGLVVIRDPFLASLYLNNLASVPSLIRAAMYGLSAFGMEVMLIYRLWIIWNRSRLIVALPAFLLLFNAAVFIIILYGDAHIYTVPDELERINLYVWAPLIFAVEGVINIYSAVLIAWRIIRDSIIVGRNLGKGVLPILHIIVESAAVYVTLTLIVVGTMIGQSPATTILIDLIPPVIGITSCLLIARVGLGMAAVTVSSRSRSGGPVAFAGPSSTVGAGLKVSVTRHALVSRDSGVVTKDDGGHDTDALELRETSPSSMYKVHPYPPPPVLLRDRDDVVEVC